MRAAAHNWQIWQPRRLSWYRVSQEQSRSAIWWTFSQQFFIEWTSKTWLACWATREESRRNCRDACNWKWNNLICNTFGKYQLCVHVAVIFPLLFQWKAFQAAFWSQVGGRVLSSGRAQRGHLPRKFFSLTVVGCCGAQLKRRPSN